MTQAQLQANNLHYERNDKVLFTKLNFHLRSHEGLHIEGINGAGKTSLLRVLTGLAQPNSGEVLWEGVPIHQCREDYNANLIYVGHHLGIKQELTPRENLQVYCLLSEKGPGTETVPQAAPEGMEPKITAALTAMGLQHCMDTPCQQLSAGQQRRVALARLSLNKVTVWLLDEPFATLDEEGITKVNALIEEHLAHKGIAIITSHQPLKLHGHRFRRLMLE